MSEQPKSPKRYVGVFIRLLVSAALFFLLFSSIDLQQFGQVVKNISAGFLLLFPLLFFASVLLSSIKWKILLENLDIKEGLGRLFIIYFISYFWGNFLPTTIGGDGYRFISLRNLHPGKDKEIFSSILLDRAYGFGTLILVHILASLYFLEVLVGAPALLWTEVAIVIALGLAFLLWSLRSAILNLPWGRYGLLENFFGKVGRILALVERQNFKIASASILLSAIFVLVGAWAWKICYASAGGEVDSLFLLYSSTLSNIVGMLPISVNGLGLVEFIQNLTVQTQNISSEIIIAASLTARVMGILMAALGGLVYLIRSPGKRLETS